MKKLPGLKIVVVGCGPVGLRAAIEFAFLGADVTVVEMRTTFSRYNILHLWDWVCHDLLELGVSNSEILGKSFYHVGTKQLQLLLAKLALCVGVRLHSGTGRVVGAVRGRGGSCVDVAERRTLRVAPHSRAHTRTHSHTHALSVSHAPLRGVTRRGQVCQGGRAHDGPRPVEDRHCDRQAGLCAALSQAPRR